MDSKENLNIPSAELETVAKIEENPAKREKQEDVKISTDKEKDDTTKVDCKVVAEISLLSHSSEGEEAEIVSPENQQSKSKKRKAVGMDEDTFAALRRRKIRVAGAPKMPLTGYVRFMNDRREVLRKEMPTKTAMEHTKIIGEEWSTMSDINKKPYMEAAEVDKQRYVSELNSFLKAHPDVLAGEMARNKAQKTVLKEKSQVNGQTAKTTHIKDLKRSSNSPPPSASAIAVKRKRTPTPPPLTTSSNSAPLTGEIPIFTNEFLEHNKHFDAELRTLRKSKADLEQQNAVLEKHVENMKFGVEKMTTENDALQEKNRLLEIYLDKLKRKLANALSTLPIPTEPNGASMDNIEQYMGELYKMAVSNNHGASLNKAKDIIRKLDLQIQL